VIRNCKVLEHTPIPAKEVVSIADLLLLITASALERPAQLIDCCLRLIQDHDLLATVLGKSSQSKVTFVSDACDSRLFLQRRSGKRRMLGRGTYTGDVQLMTC
jgi:hypothetical protein